MIKKRFRKIAKKHKKTVRKAAHKKDNKAKKPAKVEVKKQPQIEKMPDNKAIEALKSAKIPVVPYFFCKRESDLETGLKKIGFPCVLKASGNTIVHKTEIGGIIKDINNFEEAKKAYKALAKIRGSDSVLIQKQLSGIELIIGAKHTEEFGTVVSAGLGGIYVEVLRDVSFRVSPVDIAESESMIKELKGYEILSGSRGAKPIDFNKLYDAIVKVSRFAAAKKIKEMDINPLICNSEGCWAVDVRIVE